MAETTGGLIGDGVAYCFTMVSTMVLRYIDVNVKSSDVKFRLFAKGLTTRGTNESFTIIGTYNLQK